MFIETRNIDNQFSKLATELLKKYEASGSTEDRTKAGRTRIFAPRLAFDLRESFPLLEGKKTFMLTVIRELAWFAKGSVNIKDLNCSIWDEWAFEGESNPTIEKGSIGPMYGQQWRKARSVDSEGRTHEVDQLDRLIKNLKTNPYSSRLIVDSWDPALIPDDNVSVQDNLKLGYMALAPCHFAFQCFVEEQRGQKYLDLKIMIRSSDTMLGLPVNVACYALLTKLLANECGYTARHLVVDIGDSHIYGNHIEGVKEYLKQAEALHIRKMEERRNHEYKDTQLILPEHVTIFNLHENVNEVMAGLKHYQPLPHIKFPRN